MAIHVSIIVPVYNVEKYLSICVQSVISQTFLNWELLLIDDGSKDSSGVICDYFASIDPRIRTYHKRNTGVSDTRNKGLELASGDYVIFLDADDYWCDVTALQKLVDTAEKYDLDIVRGEYKAVDRKGKDLFIREISQERMKYSGRLISAYQFMRFAINGEYFLVLSLIRKKTIGEVRFQTSRVFLEDVLFYSELLLKQIRAMYLPNLRFYSYRKYEESVSNKHNPSKLRDAFSMCYEFRRLVDSACDKDIRRLFMENSMKMYYYTLDTISLNEYYTDKVQYINDFDLETLRKDVLRWMYGYPLVLISPIYYVHPSFGVDLFRFRHMLGALKQRFTTRFIKK